MQMDIKLEEGCGDLAVSWLVQCDSKPESKSQVIPIGKNLKISSGVGDIVQDENGNVSHAIQVPADTDSIDVHFSWN